MTAPTVPVRWLAPEDIGAIVGLHGVWGRLEDITIGLSWMSLTIDGLVIGPLSKDIRIDVDSRTHERVRARLIDDAQKKEGQP
jgi:hypothetical protein